MPLATGLTGQWLLGVPVIVVGVMVSRLGNGHNTVQDCKVGRDMEHNPSYSSSFQKLRKTDGSCSRNQQPAGGQWWTSAFPWASIMLRGIFEPFGKVSNKFGVVAVCTPVIPAVLEAKARGML